MIDMGPDDRFDERVRASYRSAAPRDAGAEARLLERLGATGFRRTRWWFESHLFELRPVAVAALAVTTLAAALWVGSQLAASAPQGVAMSEAGGRAAPGDAAPAEPATGVPVTFVLRTTDAARVNLVGDFNSWDAAATPLAHDASRDMWVVELNVPRGVHNYAFVLDGREWRTDPSAPLAADASFGGRTSVLVVEGARGL